MDGNKKRQLLTALLAMLGVGAAVLLLLRATAVPDGPQPIAWDREACAHCRMHIGDPHFAAQLQATDGRVLSFDDPGCLIRFRAEQPIEVRAVYFHHFGEDRWLTEGEVAFVPVASTPMGYGFGATARNEARAETYQQVASKVLAATARVPGPTEGGAR